MNSPMSLELRRPSSVRPMSVRLPSKTNVTAQSIKPTARGAIIAVLGATGSGKSSFVKGVTGDPAVKVGETMHAGTSNISVHQASYNGISFQLADCVGFDDGIRSDTEVLGQVAQWLKDHFSEGQKLAGIVYLHPITKTRLEGSSARLLRMFSRLVGDNNFGHVLLATTFWNSVDPNIGTSRERDLLSMDSAWKRMMAKGAKIERMGRDYDRFKPLLVHMAQSTPMNVQLHDELKSGKSLEETMAGMSLNTEKSHQDAKRREVQDTFKKKLAEKSTSKGTEHSNAAARLASLAEAELEQLKREDAEMARRFEARKKKNDEEVKRKEAELAEMAKKAERARAESERKRRQSDVLNSKKKLEETAATRIKASLLQRDHLEKSADLIRTSHAHGGLRINITGIHAQGSGFDKFNAAGKLVGEAVDRTSLNIWCDLCRNPIGAKTLFEVCGECGPAFGVSFVNICVDCHDRQRGCANRAHVLFSVDFIQKAGSGCNREEDPRQGLVCDRFDCRKVLTGMYFHCCECDNDDFDICIECVVLKGRGCRNSAHYLQWCVRPIEVPMVDALADFEDSITNAKHQEITELSEEDIESSDPDGTVVEQRKDAARKQEEMEALCRRSAAMCHRDDLIKFLDEISRLKARGVIRAKVIESIGGYCDSCVSMLGANICYDCEKCAATVTPSVGYSLCYACHNAGRTCVNADHKLTLNKSLLGSSNCARDLKPPIVINCDIPHCRRNVRGLYFHCCSCKQDDFDMCWDCLLKGWGCYNPSHELKIFFTPP